MSVMAGNLPVAASLGRSVASSKTGTKALRSTFAGRPWGRGKVEILRRTPAATSAEPFVVIVTNL